MIRTGLLLLPGNRKNAARTGPGFAVAFSLLLLLLFSSHAAWAQCPTPVTTIVNNTNCSTPNGKITFTGPTPLSDYLFSIDGGITYGTAGQTVFSGLFGGDYPTVSKKISSGCVSTSVTKTLANPANPAAPTSAVTNNTNCNTPNGKITFSAPTPVANYMFSVDNGVTFGAAGQTVFSGLSGGSYATVVKSVASNCVSAAAVKTLTNPVPVSPTSNVTNVTNCNTPNGSITFVGPTPLASYQFSVDGGVTFGAPGQATFNGLTAGTKVTVAKLVSTGCMSAKVNKVITSPTITAPTSAVTNVSNCNTPNGKITFSAPTPVANYSFSVNGGTSFGTAGQTVFSGLAAGSYATVVKQNSTGCRSAAVAKTVANPAVTAPTSTVTNVTNCNTPNGKITFSAPGPAGYQFSVDGGATFGTTGQTVFSNLSAGNKVTVARVASTGCRSAGVTKTIANPVLAAPTSNVAASACNAPTGTITFLTPTPLANYMFSVDNGASFGTAGQATFNTLAVGTYQTRAKVVATGCITAAAAKVVPKVTVTAPTSTAVNPTNCDVPNGSITFSAPGPAGYLFSVNGGTTFGTTGQTLFPGLDGGAYATVAQQVSSGCISAVTTKTLTDPAVTAPASTVVNVTNCAAPNGSITFTSPGPAGYQFSIDGGATFGTTGQTAFTNLSRGTYSTVAKLVSTGCMSAKVNKTVSAPVLAGADKSICLNQSLKMTGNAAAGASWSADPANPAPTTISVPTSSTTRIFGFSAPGTYRFIWQNVSCSDTVNVEVTDCSSPLSCTNFGYLFQSLSGSGTDFISVNLQTGVPTTLYTDITTAPAGINAIGYNVTDGHIWGSMVSGDSSTIARVGADGVPVYFYIPGLYPTGFNVGAIDENGILYLYTSNTTDIYRVDINPSSPTYLSLLSPVLNTTAMSIADWAYNAVDGYLYGVNTNAAAPIHQLLKINPNTGTVTVVGTVTSAHAAFNAGSFGAAYLDASGNLYISDNIAGGIYKLPVVHNLAGNTTAQFFSQGAVSNGNDGAFCSYACLKPDAGRDTAVCMTGVAKMSATSISGIQWVAQEDNPGTAIIADSSDAQTTISGFSTPGVYNFIWNSGGVCGDTASVTVYSCVFDTVTTRPPSPTCGVTICGTPGSITPTDSTTYSTCGLTPSAATQGSLGIDAGCAVWTPNGTQVDTIQTCIVTCNGGVCDTTFIVILPPGNITDTIITAMPSCSTCPVTGICPIVDDIPIDGTTVFSTCGLDASEAAQGTFAIDTLGCGTWTPNGNQTDSVTTCIVACTIACDTTTVCDTTFIIIPPNLTAPLWVDLRSFGARMQQCAAVLNWETSGELNGKSYVVERSTGAKWTAIATLAPGNDPGLIQRYSYTDAAVLPGRNQYRLKMIAANGLAKYSNVVTVNNNCTAASITLYPNPAPAGDGFRLSCGSAETVNYQVSDINGHVVREGTFHAETEIKGLPAGIYVVKAHTSATTISLRVILQ